MQNKSAAYLSATLAFSIVWAVNELLLVKISENVIPSSWMVKFVAAMGIYGAFYSFIYSFFQSHIVKSQTIEGKLTGAWFQIFQIENIATSDTRDAIRYGPISITFEGGNLGISAQSNKPSKPTQNSHWLSEQITVRQQQIQLIYKSSGPGRGETVGIMNLQFQGSAPKLISGTFNDASPATHFGHMEFFKSEDEYRKKLKELLPGLHA